MRYTNFDKTDSHKPKTLAAVGVIRFRWWFVVWGTMAFVVAIAGYYAYSFMSGLKVQAKDVFKAPGAVVSYVVNKDPQLKNENGRVNIALLGIGGPGHDGPYLSDTMIVASIDIKTGNAALISLPRDIWVPSTRSKLNAVYAYGFEKGEKQGLVQAKDAYGHILGIPIHYALRLDFSGFEKAMDLLGGIDVTVDTSFQDPEYPIDGKENDMCGNKYVEEKIASDSGEITVKKLLDSTGADITATPRFPCRYELLSFKAGTVHLDGKTALKFVRSRHGNNGEGSDFARSRRQERVITASKDKIFSMDTLLNPGKVGELLNTFGASVEMDIDPGEYGEFFKLFQRTKDAKIKTFGLSAEGKDALINVPPSFAPYGGAYVLVPVAGADRWEDVHAKVKDILLGKDEVQEASASGEASKSAIVR
jgi:anionic cell wall polymer biosynthesis LytR-Cps2A-Psr (LCP) family protein